MIIYNGTKYACASCIRGHRSSICRHTKRMLVKVRTRGRPSPIDIRDVIMVDTDSQIKNKLLQESFDEANRKEKDDFDENSPQTGSGCSGKMKNAQPILYVRVKQTKKAMLVDGKLNIILDDDKLTDENGNGDLRRIIDGDVNIEDDLVAKEKLKSLKYMPEREYLEQLSNEKTYTESAEPPDQNLHKKRESNGIFTPESDNDKRKCCDPNHIKQIPEILSDEELKFQESLFNNILGNNDTKSSVSPSSSIATTNASNNRQSIAGSELFNDIFDPKNDTVDVFTHKGIYLSADCSCEDSSCQCLNCLIHRNEEELTSYIQNSGVPLTNIHSSDLSNLEERPTSCSNIDCNCTITDCACADCFVHPTEIIPFEKFYFHGILNTKLRRKTLIKFNGKLIPSEYWWNFLKVKIPTMSEQHLESVDMKIWFDKLLSNYHSELLDATTDDFQFNDLEGFYVI